MPNDIFISYNRRDLAAVKPIKAELESLGFSCRMDHEGIESESEEFSGHPAKAINASFEMNYRATALILPFTV